VTEQTIGLPRPSDLTDSEREQMRERWTAFYVEIGYQPVFVAPFYVVLDSPGRPRINHVLHLLLTVFTFGVWAIVWFGLAVARPPVVSTRWTLSIDQWGYPHSSDTLHGPQYRNGRVGHFDARGRFREWDYSDRSPSRSGT
jgi:hypothetical protein